jgi:hypothetical protein
MLSVYVTTGQYDVVVTVEMPNGEAMVKYITAIAGIARTDFDQSLTGFSGSYSLVSLMKRGGHARFGPTAEVAVIRIDSLARREGCRRLLPALSNDVRFRGWSDIDRPDSNVRL